VAVVGVSDADFWSDFAGGGSESGDVFALADRYAAELARPEHAAMRVERDNLAAARRSGSRMRVATAVDAVAAALARVKAA